MNKPWWGNKIAYQIYPKSFLDSNGDGVGDIQGIINKLDYLAGLNIDLLWISPCFCSPMADEGYDISDYYHIDPLFGNNALFDTLLEEAKKRNIGILMDLVVNHCSDEHEWFKKACEDPDGRYGKYFIIEDFDGIHYPSNHRAIFGGRAWDLLPGHTDKVYFHCFHKKQPDLNWENPELRNEIYKMVQWWLDKGLAGFRIDAINHIKKVIPFRDYPSDGEDGLASTVQMIRDAKGLDVLLYELRDTCFKPYDAFTVGEVFGVNEELLKQNIGENGYFSSIFDFGISHAGRNYQDQTKTLQVVPVHMIKEALFHSQAMVKDVGIFSNVIENHDQPRCASHYIPETDISNMSKKCLAGIYFLVPGVPFIYQGQEIGMENIQYHAYEDIKDVSTQNMYHNIIAAGYGEMEALKVASALSRDNARTPMQWNDSENAGFTGGTPWQKVNDNYKDINVEKEDKDPDSVLNFYRKMTSLRRNPEYNDVLSSGDFIPYAREKENIIAYQRNTDRKHLLVIANYQNKACTVPLEGKYAVLLNNAQNADLKDHSVECKPYQLLVLEHI